MIYTAIADLLVGIHFTFILFTVLGGLLALKRTWVALLHLPCVLWGLLIEWRGWICPLTPLEIHFRELAGDAGYAGGFIEHYLLPLIYPDGLTPGLQIALALGLLCMNLIIYGYLVVTAVRHKRG